MHRKSSDKLFVAQNYLLFDAFLAVIFVIERYIFSINFPDSLVTDGNFMGVSAKPPVTKHYRQFFLSFNFRKTQIIVAQTFRFQQKPKPVNGVFEVRLRWRFRFFLKVKKVIVNLLGIQFCRNFPEMQRHRSDVSGVILKGTLAPSQHRNRTFKPLQKLRKSRNFPLCLIDDLVFSKRFYTLFFVAILLIFNQFYKVTKYGAEKTTEGLVQHCICKRRDYNASIKISHIQSPIFFIFH